MRFIKKFETFKHRTPTHITDVEFDLKMETYEKETFSDSEISFFEKIGIDNQMYIYELIALRGCSSVYIQLYPFGEEDGLTEIDIIKLADSWYLINEVGIDKFLCDEWDEVLGYLGTQTNLKF